MTLVPQEIEIPLTLGMSTKPSDELQEPTSMRLVQNLHWRGLGQLEKRPSDDTSETLVIPSGGNYDIDESCGLIVNDKKPLLVTGRYGVAEYDAVRDAFSYARIATTASTTPTDSLKYCPVAYDVTRRFVERTQFNRGERGIFNVASAQYNGIHVIAWIVMGSPHFLNMKAIRVDTGEVVATTEQQSIATTAAFMVQACEYKEAGKEGVLVAYINDSSSPYTVSTIRYDYASNEFVADSNLTTDCVNAFCIVTNGTSGIYFGRQVNAGLMTVERRTVTTVSATHTSLNGAHSIDIVVGSSNVLIVASDAIAGAVYAEVFGSPANVQTVMSATGESIYKVTAAAESLTGGTHDAVVFVSTVTTGTPSSTRMRCREVRFDTTTPTLGTTTTTVPNCVSVANAFSLRGMAHVIVTAYSRLNGSDPTSATSCFLARYRSGGSFDDTRLDAVAKIAHDRFYISNYLTFDVANPGVGKQGVSAYVDSNNSAWIALTADPSSVPAYGGYRFPQSIFLSRIDATRPMPMAYAHPEPGVTFVAGAMPWEYDGDSAAEASPLVEPRAVADSSSGSGVTATTGFGIRLLYEWIDARGRLKRMPGPAIHTGAFTDNQLDIYATVCPMRTWDDDDFPGEMTPKLYLTTDGGASYFLAVDSSGNVRTHDTMTSDFCWYKFTAVDPSDVSSVPWPFGDTEIEPEPTPGFAHVTKIADRMWAIDMEDRSRIWFSKPLLREYGVEWSTTCTFFIGDEAVAIIDVGGYPTILAKGGIYQVGGPGPDANGAGTFSPAQRLPFEVECLDAASVCRTPIGIVFRGRRGLYALAGGPNAEPGLLIDPDMVTAPDTAEPRTRIVFQEQTNEIHAIAPDYNSRFVYNLVERKWSEYTTSSTTCRDLAVARGKLWRLERAGGADLLRSEKLFSEDGANYNTETGVAWEIDTPWYRLDQVAGMVRLWRVWLNLGLTADLAGVGTISLSYYVNNCETALQTVTWTGAELSSALSYNPSTSERIVRLMFVPAEQIVHTFKLAISETHTGSSAGTRPLSLRLRFGSRPSLNKRNRLPPKG
jgi:hypothetical protein